MLDKEKSAEAMKAAGEKVSREALRNNGPTDGKVRASFAMRRGTPDDADRIIEIAKTFYKTTPLSRLGVQTNIDDLVTQLIQDDASSLISSFFEDEADSAVFLAEAEGEIIGFIAMTTHSGKGVEGQTIATEPLWWVREDYRGTRLGVRLLKQFEEWACSTGHDYTQVCSIDDRTGKLVERLGYTEVGRTYLKKL